MAFCLLIAQFTVITASAESTEPTIVVSSVVADAGSEVEVTIGLKNNPGIVGMSLTVEFPSELTLIEVKDAGLLGANLHNPSKTNPYYLVWANDTARENFTANGTVVTLKFKINDTAEESSEFPVTVSYDPTNFEIFDKDANEIYFAIENGKVTVTPCEHSGGEATCISPAICEKCGKAYGEINPANHKHTEERNAQAPTCKDPGYSGDKVCEDCGETVEQGQVIAATGNHIDADGKWEFDGTTHFHTCGCGTKFDFAPHEGGEATCIAKATCEVCGASYGEKDANNHKNVVLKNNVAPTCKDPGYSGDKVCEDCGETVEQGQVIAATGNHIDADGKWEFDGTTHFHTCGCGTEFDRENHKGGEATCAAKAVCEVCGASYGDVNANNHKNTHVVGQKDATCCEKGYTGDVFCDDCQTTVSVGTEIPATGNHVDADGKWEFDENGHFHTCYFGTEFDRENHKGGEATCITKATCEVCGHSYGEIDRTNHKSVVVVGAVAATETSTGYTGDKVCEDCHATVEQGSEIPMLEHKPVKVEAKAATAAEKGNIEYWYCGNCGKYYSDAEAQNEITEEETEIAKLAPTMIEGDGAKIDKAAGKGLSFKSDAAFEDFIGVEIDGKVVDSSCYTAKAGSIAVELTAEFINTLSVGEHSIAIVSESGKATATFTVSDSSAKKPDNTTDSAMAVWTLLLTVSGAAAAAVVFRKKLAK